MYGRPSSFRPDGSGRGAEQTPQQRQPIHGNPSFYQNPNFFVDPRFSPHLNTFITPIPFPPIHQQIPGLNFPVPPNSITNNFQTPPQQLNPVDKSNISKKSDVQKDLIGKLDKAVTRARHALWSSNKNVSSWEVSQAALLTVKAESWESLGFQMQQVPSLNRLLEAEGKINTFIHCFVAVRKITSLYDLEVAICESEGVERFEELELGPLIRHPLAMHYFSVTSEVTEVYRIGTQELISHLCDFVDARKRKQVQVGSFLDFITQKQSVDGREKLCVRVQDIGLYVNHIKKARQAEDTVVQVCLERTRIRALQKSKKRPLFSAQKKQLDDNFSTISQRIKSFSSESAEFGGKHIRFMSSGSEDNDSEDTDEDDQDEKHIDSNCNLSLPKVRPDHLSSCPYPSVTEEMTRLGLKNEVYSPSPAAGGSRRNIYNEKPPRKRKSETLSSTTSLHKLFKRGKFDAELESKGSGDQGVNGHSLSIESLKLFVTTWKEACRGNNPEEVLERMLQSYNIRKKKKVKALFTGFPFVGLLNAAVTSMKFGMWDNMYDTFQDLGEQFTNGKSFESSSDYISVDVEVAEKDAPISAHENLMHKHDVTAEDIAKKISGYFEDDISSFKSTSRENKFYFLRKLCKCEYWLLEQYAINEFVSLGCGEYFLFLDKYLHLLPHSLQKYLIGDILVKDSVEAYLLPLQFDALLLQALNGSWEYGNVTTQNISDLLLWQFPSACFKPVISHAVENVADIIREKQITSNCLLFSAPLLRFNCKDNSLAQNEKSTETGWVDVNAGLREGIIGGVTTKDAIDVLLKAPMLTDLSLWSHWAHMFAPSLGSIVEWLLNDVNNKELLCLVTRDAKVIRIDHLATTDSLLKVFAEGSAFETAVQLLSLFVLYGGERNVPLALLKCHARHAFELVINNALKIDLHGRLSCDHLTSVKSSNSYLCSSVPNNKCIVSKAVPVMSTFILECLSYLPIEFCSFAADVLIAGTQNFSKDVTSGMLTGCKEIEQRLMLHEVGMTLGLMEWVDDHHSFRSSASSGFPPRKSCLYIGDYELSSRSKIVKAVVNEHPSSSGERLASTEADHHVVDCKTVGVEDHFDSPKVYANGQAAISALSLFNDNLNSDPVKVIESIRKEEFGLDQSLSATGSTMLEKQHARLGRALHCLSQELYSQDSHFLLELVQNADDNIYPKNVEPTLTFILQEKGIMVLNNEQGFSAKNIRALCDVGNSTKKGNNAGYIGKKGIGFKSVFRVTDAPEIHSNGFHIKFDITEGQIGFVLPTVIPPCDIDLFTRSASANASCVGQDSWNTCIVLPFKSTLSESFAMSNIVSMFSDLHPSLLLFLHRLRCIKFRNMLDDSLVVMRKDVIGDGIIEVSLGNEKMTWFVVSQKLHTDVFHSDVQTTEISMAFTLQETSDKVYSPILNQQPVFAFLPLRTYGLKFILQGDFVLPSSREEVDGDSPWNQWLLSEFPDLFVSAEKSFCNLPCYRGRPGKAVTAFMSFIPLVGEVHGFFSSLPRVIISKLRMSNCLLSDFDENEWVPPCKVLRNWTDQTRSLLPDTLINKHLGLGFLNKDIVLSDSLARALGVEDYGPKILANIISSLCRSADGLQSMGLSWLSSWLSAIYVMSSRSVMQASSDFGTDFDLIFKLQKIPFIPLSDGTYGSVHEDTIWLYSDEVSQGINGECIQKAFPKLYAKLRIVSPNLLAAAASVESSLSDSTILENVTRMLYKIGVQRLSAHEIVKVHILPAIANDKKAKGQEDFMIEYLSYLMFHLHSSCNACGREREDIITELRENALISTNFGYRRFNEVPLHFSQEYGNPVDVKNLISGMGEKWHEIDNAYLKNSITKSISDGELKWRRFFQELGATDFVKIVQVEKSVTEMSLVNTKDAVSSKDTMSMNAVANNWESEELHHLLSWLSTTKNWEKSKYLLEILDILWDNYFSDKVKGYYIDSNGECKYFKSSLISIIQDVQWMVSSIDKELHYPKDLFHDCVAVSSVLGVAAPYTVPKVRSEKLVADVGLRTQVTLDGALSVLRHWRISESPFKASISQMSNFYTFVWKSMPLSKEQVVEELLSGPFIFVPYTSCCSQDDAVVGSLLSPQDVYWHDTIGNMDQVKSMHLDGVTGKICDSPRKMLCNFYPKLHDFFVNGCGVDESLPFRSYLQILLQLCAVSLPHQAAETVFEVFLRWSDALKSGSLSLEDIEYLKIGLLKEEYHVLPTRQDKWVSLHASYGLICWSDDDDLGAEFKHFEDVDFLYFGKFTGEENQMHLAKISAIIQRLGIPALSQIVTREAISYGPADSSFIFSLVNWILPYAQRYILNGHTDRYYQLKESGFENITQLKIVVVEELFYQNAIKRCKITSKKRYTCNCLLQDNILYCRQGSDLHAIFMEFSRLLNSGTTDLHLANFLLMVTAMAESGADEEQTEYFVLNSQKVPNLPVDEACWSLKTDISSSESNSKLLGNCLPQKVEQNCSIFKGKPLINSRWPPVDWKTAPGFKSCGAFGNKKPVLESPQITAINVAEENQEQFVTTRTEISHELNTEHDPMVMIPGAILLGADGLESQSNPSSNLVTSGINATLDSMDFGAPDSIYFSQPNSYGGDKLFGQQEALLTGRLGELTAFKYLVRNLGNASVNWVNETNETGLPYDIIINYETKKEYVEVKATKATRKNWFFISMREWQFAIEKGEAFSIALVILSDTDMAKVTIYKNPAKLCQLGNIKLAVVVPKK
ncbi:protein NO VEIN isoform X2 [Primulina eburnea]|uniref:protein NO VEIN isoform X2 n=1 Tax=Primulina eburnea TaxID=1245227 RepID=UPI003C6BE788